MVKKANLQTLEEIVFRYSIVLMDTSVLCHYLGDSQDPISIEEKMIAFEEEHQSSVVLMDYLKKGAPCFITSSVAEEFQTGDNYRYKKAIKRAGSYKDAELIIKAGSYKGKKLLELRRKIRDSCKERRRLIYTFQENNKILELTEDEHNLYNIFYKRYSNLSSSYKLSDVDFDLLIYGRVTAQTRESSALIADDFGIVRAWKHIRRQENISSKQFGFVLRKGINNFEILR